VTIIKGIFQEKVKLCSINQKPFSRRCLMQQFYCGIDLGSRKDGIIHRLPMQGVRDVCIMPLYMFGADSRECIYIEIASQSG